MPTNVVALSVENGSAGYTIAHRVAEALSFRYYDWEVTSEAARLAGVSPSDVVAAERVPGFFERTMRRLGAISTMTLEAARASPTPHQQCGTRPCRASRRMTTGSSSSRW